MQMEAELQQCQNISVNVDKEPAKLGSSSKHCFKDFFVGMAPKVGISLMSGLIVNIK